jgi:uncharacterized protein YdaU (DUF1376 family)
MSIPYMPFYPGDHLRDTRHLTTEQQGAYLLLILEYWSKGCVPDDDEQLSRIVGLTLPKWRKMRPIIQAFFRDGWRHKRIDAELAKAETKIENKRKAANVRWGKTDNVIEFSRVLEAAE